MLGQAEKLLEFVLARKDVQLFAIFDDKVFLAGNEIFVPNKNVLEIVLRYGWCDTLGLHPGMSLDSNLVIRLVLETLPLHRLLFGDVGVCLWVEVVWVHLGHRNRLACREMIGDPLHLTFCSSGHCILLCI